MGRLILITFQIEVYDADEFVVQCKELPEAITQGDSLSTAVLNGADAVCEAIAGRINRNESLPFDVPDREVCAAKVPD